MLCLSLFSSCITIIRFNSPIILQKGKCLAQPCSAGEKGEGCGRETQLAKVVCPEQSWDRSPLPGPLQVPLQGVMAPSQQTVFNIKNANGNCHLSMRCTTN